MFNAVELITLIPFLLIFTDIFAQTVKSLDKWVALPSVVTVRFPLGKVLAFRCYYSWLYWRFYLLMLRCCWAPYCGCNGCCGCNIFKDVIIVVVVVAISSNRTLEYAEEFSHIDVLVAVLTFYLKMLMMLISFYLWSELVLLQYVFRSTCYWWGGFLYYRLKLLNFSEA